MKKIILSLIIFGLFQQTYSQKKELKTIDKQIKSGEYENAINTINSIKTLISVADNKIKAKFYYLKGMARYQNGKGSFENKILSIEDFNEAKKIEVSGTKVYTEKIDNIFTDLFNSFINDSRTALEIKNYKNSYMNLEAAYNVSNKDTLYLYLSLIHI